MFANESSSDEISKSNAFKQNLKEDIVETKDVPERLAESQFAGFVSSNEVACAVTSRSAQFSSMFPTDQVPVSRDTIDCTNERGTSLDLVVAVTNCHSSLHAQMTKSVCTSNQQQQWKQRSSYSKEKTLLPSQSAAEVQLSEPEPLCISQAATTILAGESETGSGFKQIAGWKSCDCTHHPNPSSKSEALCQVGLGEAGGRAGADPTSHIFPTAIFSVSVISSSSCGTAEPPSLVTSHGAEQGFNAMFASHLGSSNSNSLSNCAQSHTISFTTTTMDVEPTHVTQAIENPNTTNQVENQETFHHIIMQSSVNCSRLDSVKEEASGSDMSQNILPSGQSEKAVEKKFTTGALSDQDNNLSNVKDFQISGWGDIVEPQQPKLDANDIKRNIRSATPVLNIPKSQGKGTTNHQPFLASAINATVQGNIDSNPPPSFNNNNKNTKNNYVKDVFSNWNEAKSTSKLLIQSATLLNMYASKVPMLKEMNGFSKQKGDAIFCKSLNGPATNARWGIPPGLGLRGGGESSLNSGTSSWGTPPSGNSNNNNSNSSSSSGWGSNSQGQSNSSTQNQWSSSNSNSSSGNNNNMNRASGGGAVGSGTSQGPSGQQNPGNSNKGNNASSGQPPSQQPPSSQAPPPQQQQQQQQQQQNGSTSWAQAAGKGLPANQQSSNSNSSATTSNNSNSNNTITTTNTSTTTSGSTNSSSGSGGSGPGGSGSAGNSSSKQQLEQINTMREALFSQDGWGGQHVNQDTGWDIPASPEPGPKDGVPVWKPNVNNGTDLWEANLRNGGQPPPSQTQKTPWGHTPTTNIGGTWGEDDDVSESSNVWTGVPSNPGPGGSGGQWGGSAGSASSGMWGAPKKDSDWGSNAGGSNWGDPRDPRSDPGGGIHPRGDPRDPRNVGGMDPRDMRSGNADPRELRGGGMLDPRDHMRGVVDPMRGDVGMRDPRDIRELRDMRGTDTMMRGDPRGRLNGAPNDGGMWAQHPQAPHHHGPHHQQSQPPGKMAGPGGVTGGGVNQWVGPPPKDLNIPVGSTKPTGWEEPSPPAQRRNIPNYDDGTSLWGNPAQQQSRMGGKVSHWKDMPNPNMSRGNMQCPPGMPQNRIPGNGTSNMKPDGTPLWGHPGRNGSWGDGPHEASNTGWGDETKGGAGGVNSWNDAPLTPTSWGGPKPKNPLNPTGWVDGDMDTSSWGHPSKQGQKPLTKDIVWASKQFRILAEMGFKKEDVENALRNSNMNIEDAHEQLTTRLNVEAWRRQEDHSPFDLAPSHPVAGFPGQRYNPVAQQMPFAPPGPGGVSNAPSLINNLNNANPSLASMNSISPAVVQKILTQQPPPQQPPTQQQAPFNQVPRTPQNQPSTAQLRMLVQQIQMAVQAGYLNHQILNQPLAPQTLLLLNQLLQQIKALQQLMQQQAVVQVQSHKGNSSAVLHISVQITKTKQQITNLQNQIASQQAIYVKQQQQQQHMASQGPQPGDFFKPNIHDPLSALQSNFGELAINKEPQMQTSFQSQQQSRLNQWKLPSLDKDGDGTTNEFSRAPGTTTKPSLAQSHSSPNINPLLGQSDGTWSTVSRTNSDTGWPDTSSGDVSGQPDNKDPWPVTTQASTAVFTDLVPEFEPGKPWKGTQMKSIEDDPSITPGSVVRSPLSLATIKDTEIFNAGSKTSPTVSSAVDTPLPPLSLSSSTWSFNPPPPTSSLGKLGGSKGTWGEAPPPTAVTSELWGAPMSKSRGPPPGLSNKGSGGTSSSNGWGSIGGVGGRSSWAVHVQGSAWGSTWLLLKNLTPQIDGSTLKTLCVQHGPLQNFHLYLNHGIALAKYSTREEANKAQGALNNCVLGNTTIFAESPADTDVHALLQHLGHGAQQQPPGSSGGSWNMRGGSTPSVPQSSKGAPPSDTWAPGGSQLWPSNPSATSLWGATPLDTSGDQHRATPSSLNSFLPGDLLGGESM